MKNDFGGLLVTGGDVTYVPHQNWRSDTLSDVPHRGGADGTQRIEKGHGTSDAGSLPGATAQCSIH